MFLNFKIGLIMSQSLFDKKIAAAIILGNTLAWGDFSLYAYFSPVLSHVFFPFASNAEAYILYFIIFALGFMFRPIGSAIAGTYADKKGRKNTLMASVVITALTTAAIGCLPSYAKIGFFSPLLLTLLRIIQTMAISAEPTNSGSLLIEHAPPEKRGFISSCVMIGIYLGFLVGIFAFLIISECFTIEQIADWGWRIPFILNLVIGIFVVWILNTTHESPVFLAKKAKGQLPKNPLKLAFQKYKLPMFISFGYSLMMAVANYFLLGFIPNFLDVNIGYNLKLANLFITLSLMITVILIPFIGYLSDKTGRKPILLVGGIGFVLFSYPIMSLMMTGKTEFIAIALIMYGIILAPVGAILSVALSEIFPFEVRCTASALGYNAALVLFGGTTPIFSQLFIHFTGQLNSPALYIALIGVLHLIFVWFSKEPQKQCLEIEQ